MATHSTILDVMFDLADFPPLSPLAALDQWAFENDDSMRAVLYQEHGWDDARFCLHYLPWLQRVTIRHLRRRVEAGEYTRVGFVVERGRLHFTIVRYPVDAPGDRPLVSRLGITIPRRPIYNYTARRVWLCHGKTVNNHLVAVERQMVSGGPRGRLSELSS